jgi:HSP20 family protein
MATLVRWQPMREAAAMHAELSRLMNGLFEGPARQTQSWVPAVDVWEAEGELVYAFDLPGVAQESISAEVEDGSLTVTAERSQSAEVSAERYHRVERRFGSFTRTVGLPQGVTEDAISASYRDGVLEIHVPKPEEAKPKKIQIGFDGGAPATIDGTATQA